MYVIDVKRPRLNCSTFVYGLRQGPVSIKPFSRKLLQGKVSYEDLQPVVGDGPRICMLFMKYI